MRRVALIGYSGHAYVVADTLLAMGVKLLGYFEKEKKENDPFGATYLGWEGDEGSLSPLTREGGLFFVCIGNNAIRGRVVSRLLDQGYDTLLVQHPTAVVSAFASLSTGTLLAPGCIVNTFARVGRGVILNTGAVIEHECVVNDYAHIAPGAILAGNVSVGERSFVGANAVVREGVSIGKNVIIGAGAVVLRDVPDNETWVGNPATKLEKHAK